MISVLPSPLPHHHHLHPRPRYLLRSLTLARKGKPLSDAVSYLAPSENANAFPSNQNQPPVIAVGADLRWPETQLRLFRGRARAAVLAVEKSVQSSINNTSTTGGKRGGGDREALVDAGVDLGR